ncbi:voltage-gated potassium channel Kch [Abditibacteriota bacterium]|nr:voltage-gated potassium channel Kch [Abditibacteriota bacterium]
MPQTHNSRGLSDAQIEALRDTASDGWRAIRMVLPAIWLFALIILGSTIGYIVLGWPAFDALYMVVISVFSVGYGEVHPVVTITERLWTMAVIFAGWIGVVITLGGITKAVTEGELRRATQSHRTRRAMDHLKQHVIICGYGRMGQTLARELQRAHVSFVIIDRDEERVAQITTDGFLAYRGDATEESVLESCGIERATFLATVLPQDALNVFITLTARNLSRSIKIFARGEQPSTERKLRQAGADEVISPAQIGALRIAHAVVEPEIAAMVHHSAGGVDLSALGVEVDELYLHDNAGLLGQDVRALHRQTSGEIMVLAVRRSTQLLRDAIDDLVLQRGDVLLVVSRSKQLPPILARDVDRAGLL